MPVWCWLALAYIFLTLWALAAGGPWWVLGTHAVVMAIGFLLGVRLR